MSRHIPPRTELLFTGTVGHTFYNRSTSHVKVQMREDQISFTRVDDSCNVQVGAIDNALASFNEILLLTVVAPGQLITNVPVVSNEVFSAKPLIGPKRKWLQFVFKGTQYDASRLGRGTPIQVYAINLDTNCPSEESEEVPSDEAPDSDTTPPRPNLSTATTQA